MPVVPDCCGSGDPSGKCPGPGPTRAGKRRGGDGREGKGQGVAAGAARPVPSGSPPPDPGSVGAPAILLGASRPGERFCRERGALLDPVVVFFR